jgi:alanyl-tRNA synthetase
MAARRAGATSAITTVLADATIESLGLSYPNLIRDADLVHSVLSREEEGFDRTLRTGMSLLDEATADVVGSRGMILGGDIAFKLHDTHGFPVELTEELVAEKDLSVDRDEFDSLMAAQRERARASARQPRAADEEQYRRILEDEGPTVFVGRSVEDYSVPARVLAVLNGADGVVEIFLDRSPFYAESGGQMGDTGSIVAPLGSAVVLDTIQVLPGLHAHRCTIDGEIHSGDDVVASIDGERREALRRNHTATHLLHAALREILGDHVRQQGSLVAPDRLRFDFSHHAAPTRHELDAITTLVNRRVLADEPVETTETSRSAAEQMGAVAFFGDKYGETVRVVKAGSESLEFCGGTHVEALGAIGQIQIISEGSIGSNTRRIEAVTGAESVRRSLEMGATITAVAGVLKAEPDTIIEALERALERAKAAERERDALRSSQLEAQAASLATDAEGGILVTHVEAVGADDLRQMAGSIRQRGSLKVVVLGSSLDGKVAIAVATDETIDAVGIVKEIGGLISGGGGGSPRLAVAGGKKPEGLSAALDAARASLHGR